MKLILVLALSIGLLPVSGRAQGTLQTQKYTGQYAGLPIVAQLDWRRDKTLIGTFQSTTGSGITYRMSGTNFVDGQVELIVLRNGIRRGSGTLYKRIQSGLVIWSGTIQHVDGTTATLNFSRARDVVATPSRPSTTSRAPAPSPSTASTSRGPVPMRIRADCAMEADPEAYELFLAYGPLNESNAPRIIEMWRQSANQRQLMAYTRCLNVNWNFKR